MYMSVPLLAQYGKLTGNNEYYDDAVKQVLQMSKYLFVPSRACTPTPGMREMPTIIRAITGAGPTAGAWSRWLSFWKYCPRIIRVERM